MPASEESLAFHASAPAEGTAYVLLLRRPDEEGWVRFQRWESPDYTAETPERRRPASEVYAAIAREKRAGWRFTLPPDHIRAWLLPGER